MATGAFQAEDFIQDSDSTGLVDSASQAREGILQRSDGLKLTGIDDTQFIKVVNKWIKESKDFYERKYNLTERRQEMEKYRFGRQLKDVKMEPYNSRFIDNAIFEAESYLIPIVFAQMPDIIVKPGENNPQAKQVADDISKVVSTDIQSRERKKVLKQAFSHHPVYLTGVIKAFWNPQKGEDGDYDFKTILPTRFIADHTAQSNKVEDMRFTAEYVDYSVKEWMMRFPNKKKQFIKRLQKEGLLGENAENSEVGLNSIVQGIEVHFRWFVDSGGEFEEIVGVAWLYKDILFDKIKDPNWDWSGEKVTFSYKKPLNAEMVQQSISSGEPIKGINAQTIFHNFLAKPEFPYFLMGYDQWGKIPYDETSRIEQAMLVQQNYDRSGKQVSEMLRTRTKHVFSSASGLKKEDLQQFDPNDPMQDFLISGDVRETYTNIPREQVSSADLDFLQLLKQRIFEIEGVNQPVRGQVDSQAPATSAQIGREGDFTRADDLTDDTVNAACEWEAHWILQFIKLRYTKDHLVRLLGPDGQPVFISINQNMIQRGMEISITASGVDKLKAIQNAFDLAKLKMIDPLNMFKDLDLSDPEGRAMDLMMSANPAQYTMYLQSNRDPLLMTQQMEGQLNAQPPQGGQDQPGQPQGGQANGSQEALFLIQQIQMGNIPQVPQQIDPSFMQTLMSFINSTDFEQLLVRMEQVAPGFKTAILGWLRQVVTIAQSAQSQPTQPQAQPQASVGPMAQGPSPDSTSQVAAAPPQIGAARASAV